MKVFRVFVLLVLLMLTCTPVYGEEANYNFQAGPQKITLDNKKNTLDLPAGYSYLNKAETAKLYKEHKGPYDDARIAIVFDDNSNCFAVLSYDETGYIKDDDADKLDANALLEEYRRGTAENNKQSKEQGIAELEVVGWDSPPQYDKINHVLQWAIRGHEKGSDLYVLNHNAVLLGRSGRLECVVVGEAVDAAKMDAMRALLASRIAFTPGNDYLSWKKGDKVSDITLAGLITGGAATAAYAASKGGLLAKLGVILLGLKKALILIVVAVGVFLKKIWDKISGKHTENEVFPAATAETEDRENQTY